MKVVFLSYGDVKYSRSAVYFSGTNLEKYFRSVAPGLLNSLKTLWKLQGEFNTRDTILVVMSPSHLLAIYLALFTKFVIVLDAGWPLSDSSGESYIRIKNTLIDYLAFNLADSVIFESKAQVRHSQKKFKLNSAKLYVLYTGLNETQFKHAEIPPELANSTELYKRRILFRGKNNQESGLDKIIKSAYQLPEVQFVIVTNYFDGNFPKNVLLITRYLSTSEISWLYQNTDGTLGQFGENKRLDRTIPHKLFESMFYGRCYFSPSHGGILEILMPTDFVEIRPNDALQLALEIKKSLIDTPRSLNSSKTLRINYDKFYSQEILCKGFLKILESTRLHKFDRF